MFHKLQDGDIIKILPLLRKNGEVELLRVVSAIFINNKFIYDDSDKNYLRRMKSYPNKNLNTISIIERKLFCAYVNGSIRFISVGKSLYDIIKSAEKYNISDNRHILVKIRMVDTGSLPLPSYDNSSIIEKEWDIPVSNKNSQSEWIDWIKNNQPGYLEDFLEKSNIFNNILYVKKAFGGDFLTELIVEDRDKKIKHLLND